MPQGGPFQLGIENSNTQVKVCFSPDRKLASVYRFEIGAQINKILVNVSLKEYSSTNTLQNH